MAFACLRLGNGFGKLQRQCRFAGFQKVRVWFINQPDEITRTLAQEPMGLIDSLGVEGFASRRMECPCAQGSVTKQVFPGQ